MADLVVNEDILAIEQYILRKRKTWNVKELVRNEMENICKPKQILCMYIYIYTQSMKENENTE